MNLKSILLPVLLALSMVAFGQTPSIITEVTPTSICPGDTLTIIIVTSDTFASDNVFTVELSDSTGSFASPDTLDTISGQSTDTLYLVAPVVTPSTSYLIRAVGSDPSVIGVPTINNLNFRAMLPPPNDTLTLIGSPSICKGDSLIMSFQHDSALVFTWWFNGVLLNDTTHYSFKDKDSVGMYVIQLVDTTTAGCSVGYDTVITSLHAFPPRPAITSKGKTGICGSGRDTLVTSATGNITYQWMVNGSILPKDTFPSYSADATGSYAVIVTSFGCSTSSSSIRVTLLNNPVVTFNLTLDSFCLYYPPVTLSGGSPAGGIYTGSFVEDYGIFDQDSSGVGTFTVTYTYTDSIGCFGSDSQQITIYNDCSAPSGIDEQNNEPSFSMYPNPASQNVSVTVYQTGGSLVKVFDLTGRQIYSQQFNTHVNIPVENIPSGIYLVEISSASLQWKKVSRLVVE